MSFWDWVCSKCNTEINGHMSECWKCPGADHPGLPRDYIESHRQSEAECDPEWEAIVEQPISEYEWASSRPEWHDRLGQCCYLIVTALKEQDRLPTTLAARFLHLAEEMAAHTICYRVTIDIDLARKFVGTTEPIIKQGEELPF